MSENYTKPRESVLGCLLPEALLDLYLDKFMHRKIYVQSEYGKQN